jgi:hypothetical protein
MTHVECIVESGDEQEESDDYDGDLLMMIPVAVMMSHSYPWWPREREELLNYRVSVN